MTERAHVPPAEAFDLPAAGGPRAGRVHSGEVVGTVNGPGLRYTLYLSGCPLRCLYCHNPETWQMRMGELRSVDDVVADISSYATFLTAARGGLTVSGGEPLLQPAFVTALFGEVKQRWGLHTALDTSGFLGARAGDDLLDLTDLVLLDVKAGSDATHRRVTGRGLEPTLRFLDRLDARSATVWVRYVLVPGLTDDLAEVEMLADRVAARPSVECVEVLPYHDFGRAKYEALGLPYPLGDTPAPTAAEAEACRQVFRSRGLTTF